MPLGKRYLGLQRKHLYTWRNIYIILVDAAERIFSGCTPRLAHAILAKAEAAAV